MNKKRYAGLLWTNTVKHDKMDCKGIETVRRDNCQLVKDVVDTSLRAILIHKVRCAHSSARDVGVESSSMRGRYVRVERMAARSRARRETRGPVHEQDPVAAGQYTSHSQDPLTETCLGPSSLISLRAPLAGRTHRLQSSTSSPRFLRFS